MALALTVGRSAVTFTYTDDNMTATWSVTSEDGQEKLISTMQNVIGFVQAHEGLPALPQRIPGMALGMAQTAHPPMQEAVPGNGWAKAVQAPEIPEDRRADWEFMPPEVSNGGD